MFRGCFVLCWFGVPRCSPDLCWAVEGFMCLFCPEFWGFLRFADRWHGVLWHDIIFISNVIIQLIWASYHILIIGVCE